jgi:hypothetical protein
VSIKYKCPYQDTVSAAKIVLNYGATNVAPTQKDKPLLSSKRRPHLQTQKWSWKEQKLSYDSRRGPKPTTTVLARANSNLLLWYDLRIRWGYSDTQTAILSHKPPFIFSRERKKAKNKS